jgi:hypothetical protein
MGERRFQYLGKWVMKWNRRSGTVVDAEQRPVPGALVAVEWGTAPTPEIAVETKGEGRFTIVLPGAGRFRIRATAPNGTTGSREVDGADQQEIKIELERL